MRNEPSVPVYLDHAATTPILPEALAAFTAALGTVGNPSSIHSASMKRSIEAALAGLTSASGQCHSTVSFCLATTVL